VLAFAGDITNARCVAFLPQDIITVMKCLALVVFIAGCVDATGDAPFYIGCFRDCNDEGGCPNDNRDLTQVISSCESAKPGDANQTNCGYGGSSVQTPALCSALCTGFKFFGVQNGEECHCGNDYGNQGGKAPDNDCGTSCNGDSSIMCGGSVRNSIYAQPHTSTAYNITTKAN
jgi:hypothetical protein